MVYSKTTQTSKSSSSPQNSKTQRRNNLSMRSFLTKTWVGVFSSLLVATITSSSRTKHSSTIEQQNRMKKYDEMCKHNRSEEVPLSQYSDVTANSLSQIFYGKTLKNNVNHKAPQHTSIENTHTQTDQTHPAFTHFSVHNDNF